MLAGEISTILLSAKVSTTFSETLDDAAPMTTDGLLATSVPADAVETDMSVESPESWMSWQAVAPLTPPAALMSETARPTPEISGGTEEGEVAGERQDAADAEGVRAGLVGRALVVGERVAAGADSEAVAEGVSLGLRLGSPSAESSPQAVRARLRTAVPAISRTQVAVLVRFTG